MPYSVSSQWTVVPTVVSWSESSYLSYGSTTVITIVTTVPCPVYTSYTTLTTTDCPGGCPGPVGAPVCMTKTCSTLVNDVVYFSPTAYDPGQYAPAGLTANGVVETTYIDASQCSTWAPFVDPGWGGSDITCCGGVTTPVPVVGATCIYKPCWSDGSPPQTFTGITTYDDGEQAIVLVEATGVLTTPASLCSTYIYPPDGQFGCQATESCAAETGSAGTCGATIVTYSYTSDGATIVVATNIPSHCGPFSLSGSGHRPDGGSANILFWLWSLGAALSGIAMIAL